MKHIKNIILGLENCETIDITDGVGDFYIEDITYEVCRIACNAISKIARCGFVEMQLFNKNIYKGELFNGTNHLDRLEQWPDITSIDIVYTDDTKESFYPEWSEDSISKNKYQTSKRDNRGNLYIVISKTKTVEEIYSEEKLLNAISTERLFLREDIKAKLNLISDGWSITWEDDNLVQLHKNNVVVNLSRHNCTITNLLDFDNKLVIRNTEFYDIETLAFYILEQHSSLQDVDLKYLHFKYSGEAEDRIDEDVYRELISDNKLYSLRYIEDKKDQSVTYTGEVVFNKCNISILGKDIINMMWIHHTLLDDDFWRVYK